MSTNKRVVLTGPREVKIVEEPIPKSPPKGLIIKTHYAGVCHTDKYLWHDECRIDDETVVSWTKAVNGYKFPLVMGHEIAGEVYEIGNEDCTGAPELKKGDYVIIYPYTGCGTCGMCCHGENNSCEINILSTSYGVVKDGGHQTYVSVESRQSVQKLPAGVGLDVANMLTCSALTAYNALSKAMPAIQEGHVITGAPRVLIVGAGGLGLWAVQWAKALCPPTTKVYVADVTPQKIEDAKKQGADGGVLWPKTGDADEIAAEVIKQCGGKLDGAMDFVGSAETAKRVFRVMRNRGTQVLVGLAGGTLPVPIMGAIVNQVNICGVAIGSPQQMAEVTKYVSEKKVTSPPLHVFKPEQCAEVLQMLEDGKLAGRGILDFTE